MSEDKKTNLGNLKPGDCFKDRNINFLKTNEVRKGHHKGFQMFIDSDGFINSASESFEVIQIPRKEFFGEGA